VLKSIGDDVRSGWRRGDYRSRVQRKGRYDRRNERRAPEVAVTTNDEQNAAGELRERLGKVETAAMRLRPLRPESGVDMGRPTRGPKGKAGKVLTQAMGSGDDLVAA
jgi:hypothetical protein